MRIGGVPFKRAVAQRRQQLEPTEVAAPLPYTSGAIIAVASPPSSFATAIASCSTNSFAEIAYRLNLADCYQLPRWRMLDIQGNTMSECLSTLSSDHLASETTAAMRCRMMPLVFSFCV